MLKIYIRNILFDNNHKLKFKRYIYYYFSIWNYCNKLTLIIKN